MDITEQPSSRLAKHTADLYGCGELSPGHLTAVSPQRTGCSRVALDQCWESVEPCGCNAHTKTQCLLNQTSPGSQQRATHMVEQAKEFLYAASSIMID